MQKRLYVTAGPPGPIGDPGRPGVRGVPGVFRTGLLKWCFALYYCSQHNSS